MSIDYFEITAKESSFGIRNNYFKKLVIKT